jgi:hypothetical protein
MSGSISSLASSAPHGPSGPGGSLVKVKKATPEDLECLLVNALDMEEIAHLTLLQSCVQDPGRLSRPLLQALGEQRMASLSMANEMLKQVGVKKAFKIELPFPHSPESLKRMLEKESLCHTFFLQNKQCGEVQHKALSLLLVEYRAKNEENFQQWVATKKCSAASASSRHANDEAIRWAFGEVTSRYRKALGVPSQLSPGMSTKVGSYLDRVEALRKQVLVCLVPIEVLRASGKALAALTAGPAPAVTGSSASAPAEDFILLPKCSMLPTSVAPQQTRERFLGRYFMPPAMATEWKKSK